MMIRNLFFGMSICFSTQLCMAQSKQSFVDFLHEFVQPGDWEDFKVYYENQLQAMHKKIAANGGVCSQDDIKILSLMEQAGQEAIKKSKGDISHLAAGCADEQSSKQYLKTCYIRYGSYARFLEDRQMQSATFMGKVSQYWGSMKNRLSCWAQSIRSLMSRRA